MAGKTITLTDAVYEYMLRVSLREPEVLKRLREETARLSDFNMQIAPEQGQFMALLVKLMGVRRAVEVGTYTGYSAISIASQLPPEGRLIACDINETTAGIARRYFALAGVADRIDLRIGPAVRTLDAMIARGESGSIDFMFVDADKESYCLYLERGYQLLRQGGLMLFDNMLWGGLVADPRNREASTQGVRALNEALCADQRFDISLIPVADGITLALKR